MKHPQFRRHYPRIDASPDHPPASPPPEAPTDPERIAKANAARAAMVARSDAKRKHFSAFYALFRVRLTDYWSGDWIGLDVVKFDREVIKSGDDPMLDVIHYRYGAAAVTMIEELTAA